MRTFNFADLLEIVAETVPERIALVHGQSELSYAALNEQSKRVAAVLSSHGVGREIRSVCSSSTLRNI